MNYKIQISAIAINAICSVPACAQVAPPPIAMPTTASKHTIAHNQHLPLMLVRSFEKLSAETGRWSAHQFRVEN